MKNILLFISFFAFLSLDAQTKKSSNVTQIKSVQKPVIAKEKLVEVITPYGNMIVKLYDSTPKHRDNFIKLVSTGFYDSLLFHRVINEFMIQGGDPTSKNADTSALLGNGEAAGDMVPAEFNARFIHKKGALAAARTENPEKASSNCQFYIVQGKKYDDAELNTTECSIRNTNPSFSYTDAQRKIYTTIGGTPFLDQNYTVFGEVVKGLDVVDKIASAATDPNDRPLKNISMKMRMLN